MKHFQFARSFFIVAVIAALVACSTTICTADNPNHKPEAMSDAFAVRDKEYSEALKEEALNLCLSADKDIQAYKKTLEDRGAERLSNKSLGKTYVELNNLDRAARKLSIRGETAGADFLARGKLLRDDLKMLISRYQTSQNGTKVIATLIRTASKQATARTKEAQRIQKLFDDRKLDQAEERMNKSIDVLHNLYCVLPAASLNQIFQPFSTVHGLVKDAAKTKRTREAIASANEQFNQEKPDFTAMLSEIKTAIAAVGSGGSATWGEETVTGPQLVAKIGDQWKAAQTKTLRCRAIGWSIGLGRSQDMSSTTASKTPLEKEFDKFSIMVVGSLSDLIEADAARVSDTEAEALYVAYLNALAPIQRLSFANIEKKVDKALDQLAGKSPALLASVENFDLATSELLRWRKRAATSMAAGKLASFPSITEKNFKAAKSTPDFVGLYSANNPIVTDARILNIPPRVMPKIITHMMGKDVSFQDAVKWSSKDTSPLIGRYQDRVYGSIPSVALEIRKQQVDALKSDLMVDDQKGPLSLDAALAIESLTRSDARTVGGTVEGIFMESVVTRFGGLPEAIGGIVPYGSLPAEPSGVGNTHVLIRYTIAPKWVQFDYAFVDLAQATAANPGS